MLLDVLGLVGLLAAFLGSVIIILPDIPRIQTYVMPEDEFSRLRTAQQRLLTEHEITDEETGFDELCNVLETVVDLPIPPHTILIDERRGGDETEVHIRYTNEDADHAFATAYAGHPSHMMLLVEEEIRNRRQQVQHRFLTFGVVFLILGFGLRATVYALQNFQ